MSRKGQPVARRLPGEKAEVQHKPAEGENTWDDYLRFLADLRSSWPKGLTTQQLMDEIRREL